MAYWLLKADPGDYGFADLVRDRKTVWDGVSNHLALKHIRAMKRGDLAFIYHSGSEKALVGIAQIGRDPYPDPGKDDARLVVFDLKPEKRLSHPVSLAQIKSDARFKEFELVRMPRLSVMPVSRTHWKQLLKMAGEKE